VIRLQKVMAERGVASRRHAEELISGGRVRVDGELVTRLGTRVAEDARIEVDGRPVAAAPARRYVLLNKPVGIVSTAQDERGRRTVVDHIGARERLFPVGRLDTDSEGLLLLTNDGAWAERVLHPRYGHEREYDAWVEGDLTEDALARLQRGIPLEEGVARAVRVAVRSRSRGRSRLSLVLRTGWKRQVRRMCLAVGLKVTRLVRIRMGPLELGKLRPGEFRDLTKKEIDAMAVAAAPPRPAAAAAGPAAARGSRSRVGLPAPRVPDRRRDGGVPSTLARENPTRRVTRGGVAKQAPRHLQRPATLRGRETRAAPGPAARRMRRTATLAAAPRAPAREGSPTRRGGVSREERVSAPRRPQRGARA
jgi:23S rRNA pseudouridine2605 synthase